MVSCHRGSGFGVLRLRGFGPAETVRGYFQFKIAVMRLVGFWRVGNSGSWHTASSERTVLDYIRNDSKFEHEMQQAIL